MKDNEKKATPGLKAFIGKKLFGKKKTIGKKQKSKLPLKESKK